MRLNQYVAKATGLSRRKADQAIMAGRVLVNQQPAVIGQDVVDTDSVTLDGVKLAHTTTTTVLLNKPAGYVCSRDGQGSRTVYDLLPKNLHNLKPVGRLDKDSSGLLLLTNDGQLAYELTHPKFAKDKVYEIELNKPLGSTHKMQVDKGVQLEDGSSKLKLKGAGNKWQVTLHEGRNRQIRRTFEALGYTVTKLHRTQFGPYQLAKQKSGTHQSV